MTRRDAQPRTPARHSQAKQVARRKQAERRGHWAEGLAVASYMLRLYRPMAIREKTPVGEIDLVLRRGGTIVFAEVKLRSNLDEAASAVTPRQRERIARAASYYLARHPGLAELNGRFDVVCIAPWRWPRHVENAFPAAS
jgi:putative endonuclease